MLFIVIGSTAKNLGLVMILASVVLVLGYVFFKYNYNFATLKQKILLKRKVDKLKGKSKDNNEDRKNGRKKKFGDLADARKKIEKDITLE